MPLTKIGGKDGYNTYTNLHSYVLDNTVIGPLLYHKLDYLFKLFFSLQTGLLFVQLIHRFVCSVLVPALKMAIKLTRELHFWTQFPVKAICFLSFWKFYKRYSPYSESNLNDWIAFWPCRCFYWRLFKTNFFQNLKLIIRKFQIWIPNWEFKSEKIQKKALHTWLVGDFSISLPLES